MKIETLFLYNHFILKIKFDSSSEIEFNFSVYALTGLLSVAHNKSFSSIKFFEIAEEIKI